MKFPFHFPPFLKFLDNFQAKIAVFWNVKSGSRVFKFVVNTELVLHISKKQNLGKKFLSYEQFKSLMPVNAYFPVVVEARSKPGSPARVQNRSFC